MSVQTPLQVVNSPRRTTTFSPSEPHPGPVRAGRDDHRRLFSRFWVGCRGSGNSIADLRFCSSHQIASAAHANSSDRQPRPFLMPASPQVRIFQRNPRRSSTPSSGITDTSSPLCRTPVVGSINTLTVISISRYIKGCHPNKAHCITSVTVLICIIFIWTGAVFWSGAPILGWGSYTDRGYGTCEIDWVKANYSTIHKSYIISILIFCFFIPVLIMLFSYISIINTVKRGNAMSAEGDLTDRQRKIERDVTVVSIVICTAFILAWSPYAVVSMWSAWGFHVPSLTSIFTRLFAKSASFYNPLIYFGLSSKFRRDVSVLLPCGGEARDAVKLKRFKEFKGKADGKQEREKIPSGKPRPQP
ncbi:opsin-5-like [Cyprinus carpio]|uniref:Opsin-5-like n=1 Tax=Cyprinus carpio TaxID=7962 RepID=A0A9Q9WTR3_CYPCA|nr:opsin-5-like [Cyprinus carpio]